MRIDAHQHFWDPSRDDYGWLEALEGEAARKLRRPFLPEELEPSLKRHGFSHTVLVQAAPSEAEGEFLLSLARQHAFVAGVVVWLDMEAPDFERRLESACREPKLVGIRPMIQDLPDPDWMLGPRVRRAFAVLESHGVCFDFLVRPAQLPAMLQILQGYPKLRAVLDHIGKPDIRARQVEPWGGLLARIAEHPNVYCKLSGMLTEAHPTEWTAGDLVPYVRHAVERFGPERCMFGSDWPVCTLAASYDEVVEALEHSLAPLALGAAPRARIFGEAAAEFYRLSAPHRREAT